MNKDYFTSYQDIPHFTEKGFMVIKCPKDIGGVIQDLYNMLLQFPEEKEELDNSPYQNHANMYDLGRFKNIVKFIHGYFLPLHEQWCKQTLIPSAVWGIRSYVKGSYLKEHCDRPLTHHISSIIMVDKDLNNKPDWALDIQSHDGEWNKVYTEPGDMILYESACCVHGRRTPFEGNYFRNFYMHYKIRDLDYVGREKKNN